MSRKLFLFLFLLCSFTDVVSGQSEVPLRDTTFFINICTGIDTTYELPYSEPGVQYRWLPEFGPVQNVNSYITPIQYTNLSDTVVTFLYQLIRTYPNTYSFIDTIYIRVFPEPNLQPENTSFSLCPGDTGRLNYIPQNNSYLSFFPSEQTKLDTVDEHRMLFWPNANTDYDMYIVSQGGCTRGPFNVHVNVGAFPPVQTVDFPDFLCSDSDPIKLNQYVDPPYIGTFSGQGIVSDTTFFPSMVGTGDYPITYTMLYQNCYFSVTDTIHVVSPSSISMVDIPNFCLNDPKFLLNVGNPTGGEYSGEGVDNGYFSPYLSGVGSSVITYSINIQNECLVSTSQTVTVIPLPTKPTLTLDPGALVCGGDSVLITSSFFTNYGWNTGENTQSIWVDAPGDYFVRIQSLSGCANYSDTATVQFSEPPQITELSSPFYPNGHNVSYNISSDGIINLSVENGQLPYTFLWSNGAQTEDLLNIPAGDYTITVKDSIGCTAQGEITLTRPDTVIVPPVIPELEFSLPNGFTPNADGFNDFYHINSLMPVHATNTFRVWDIRRQLVFSASNYDNTWSGLDLKGKKLPAGTYFAVFESPALQEPVKTFIDIRYE